MRRSLSALCAAFVLSTAISPVLAGSALADPAAPVSQPGTSEDAKSAWITAAQNAEALNQQVLVAAQTVLDAREAAATAQAASDALLPEVAAAEAAVTAADAEVAVFQPKLDAVASASLRGAGLGQMSVLLTAKSPADYLDQATALDRVAGEQLQMLAGAKAAKQAADTAKAAADAKKTAAQAAADQATSAVTAAEAAAADLATQQAAMKDQMVAYEQLYTSLSVGERGEAIAAFESSYISPEAQALLDSQAQARADAGITEETLSAIAVKQAPDLLAGIAVAAALTRRGLPYVWGAVGPDSFDCSGLMQWAWEQAGVSIPRTSAEQAGLPEVPLDQLQPGDLVTYYSPVTHVGMYVGNGLVMHASMPGVPISVVPLEKAGPSPSGHRVQR